MPNPKSILNGQVGEHLVCAELLRRRHVTCIMPAGYPDIDLVVLDQAHEVRHLVQVKFTPKRTSTWVLNDRSESVIDAKLIYVLVCISTDGQSYRFFCIPAGEVAPLVKAENEAYVLKAQKRRPSYMDNSMRRITLAQPLTQKYEGNFGTFGVPSLPRQLQ